MVRDHVVDGVFAQVCDGGAGVGPFDVAFVFPEGEAGVGYVPVSKDAFGGGDGAVGSQEVGGIGEVELG